MESDVEAMMLACIAFSCPNLQAMDIRISEKAINRITGSNISDSGIGMICNELTETLSRLLLALCPNITLSGIQFAVAQLPYLELMDCGMTLCYPNSNDTNDEKESISDNNDPQALFAGSNTSSQLNLRIQREDYRSITFGDYTSNQVRG